MRRIDPKLQRFTLPAAALAALVLPLGSDFGDYTPSPDPHWSGAAIERLEYWAKAAPADALPLGDTGPLDAALQRGNARATDQAATELALNLARKHLLGAIPARQRVGWHIADTDTTIDLPTQLRVAITTERIDDFFASLRPDNPAYTALKGTLAAESDPARRKTLARTMERWRWLPRSLGDDYLLANAAGFEVTLWRSGKRYKSWAAISGKPKTPTPAISAMVKAVNFNPWWEVPDSIAMESHLAGRGSYVWNGKRFRQKPGPGNALGQMKLVMPKPYNIYLHDTPSRGLFDLGERAFSHGCIRVGDALGFALTLLEGSVTREQIDKRLKAPEGGEVQSFSVPLPEELPVYVTYFTASMRADGSVAFHKDIYGRDAGIAVKLD